MTSTTINVTAFPEKRKLGTLEVGRGVAALGVVAHHAGLSSDAFTASDYAWLLKWGIYGVDFFFVLSGFIIYHIHQSDPREPGAAINFLIKRIRRIYIPYLPITAFLIAAYLLLPGLSQGARTWGWFTSLTLMPSSSAPALSVAWTLTFEMIFYLFFLSFFITRFFWFIMAVWVILVLALSDVALSYSFTNPLFRTLFDPLILEFVAGMVSAYLFQKLSPKQWYPPLIVGGVGVILFFLLPDASRVMLGVAFAPIVLGLALAEENFTINIPKVWMLFGASSYAIYLIHTPLQSPVARVLQQQDSWITTFALCVTFSVAAGVLYHLIYEKPLLRFFARRSGSRTANNSVKP